MTPREAQVPVADTPISSPTQAPIWERVPFRSALGRPGPHEVTLRGALPTWLHGDLVRTAPALWQAGAFSAEHWFDAFGMLYAFRIEDGAVRFDQHLLECEALREARAGQKRRATFATPTGRPWWKRLFSPLPFATDNLNVNVVPMGDERVVLSETPTQYVVDGAEPLAIERALEWEDDLGPLSMIAHPHYDFARDRVVSVATHLGASNWIGIVEHPLRSRKRELVAKWKPGRLPYVHDLGLTPRFAILIAHPYTVNPLSFLFSDRGFADHFRWDANEPTRLIVIDRHSGEIREHTAPAAFVFHTVHAWEEGDDVVLDVVQHEDGIVERLGRKALEGAHVDLPGKYARYRMQKGKAAAEVDVSDAWMEFPATSARRVWGRRQDVAFGMRMSYEAGRYRSHLVRVEGATLTHREVEVEGVAGEPVFVARPGAEADDDGVLLMVSSALDGERASMLVYDASTMTELASAQLDLPLPLGFHGSFFRG